MDIEKLLTDEDRWYMGIVIKILSGIDADLIKRISKTLWIQEWEESPPDVGEHCSVAKNILEKELGIHLKNIPTLSAHALIIETPYGDIRVPELIILPSYGIIAFDLQKEDVKELTPSDIVKWVLKS